MTVAVVGRLCQTPHWRFTETLYKLVEIVRLASDELFVRERSDLACFNQNNAIRVLHFAFDQQKCFFGDHEPKSFEQIRLDNRI